MSDYTKTSNKNKEQINRIAHIRLQKHHFSATLISEKKEELPMGKDNKANYLNIIDEKRDELKAISDYIQDNPELNFDEYKSSECVIKALKKYGFEVETNLAGIKTAFSGTYGKGYPVIGILGEFDALSGLGQVEFSTIKASDGHQNRHGCGHNLLCVGSLAAALAIKQYLETTKKDGTVIYFGCPAEEGGSGKAFMAKHGVFDKLDFALSWHPSAKNMVRTNGSLSNFQVLYKFDGISSHASAFAYLGRSALDAVELMDVGVNYLREHLIPEARVHYAILDTGGISPNVVQSHAEVLYLMRAPKNDQLTDIYERINNIAEGAALMTGTKASHDFIKGCSSLVMNDTIQQMMQEIAEKTKQQPVSEKEFKFAQELSKTLSQSADANEEEPLMIGVLPYTPSTSTNYGSTDVGDVSWNCPTAQMLASTWIKGTQGHTWQATAQGKTNYAVDAALWSGKILAQTAVKMIENPSIIEKAKEEHKQKIGNGYICPIPDELKPRSIASLAK